jgi:hypothetical protein
MYLLQDHIPRCTHNTTTTKTAYGIDFIIHYRHARAASCLLHRRF